MANNEAIHGRAGPLDRVTARVSLVVAPCIVCREGSAMRSEAIVFSTQRSTAFGFRTSTLSTCVIRSAPDQWEISGQLDRQLHRNATKSGNGAGAELPHRDGPLDLHTSGSAQFIQWSTDPHAVVWQRKHGRLQRDGEGSSGADSWFCTPSFPAARQEPRPAGHRTPMSACC